uniref:DNA repair protein n=1 Tax=Staphylothermus marinus TaxID=2280 RepID=A0A7C4D9N5_STAMA
MILNNIDPRTCTLCRGRNWCGLAYCPLLARKLAFLRIKKITNSLEVYGSSPPSVFVGRHGYPYVNIGPSAPPETGDTTIFDFPEKWIELRLEDIIDYRLSLLTGSIRVKASFVSNPFIQKIHEIALSIKPVDIELYFEKPITPRIELSEFEPPQGPRGVLRSFRITSNPVIPRIVDSVYNDKDLSAREALLLLYKNGIPVSVIQRILSVGALGRSRSRKLVPTRWSITAVDSTISEELLESIRKYSLIDNFELYVRKYYDNTFIAILAPFKWSFEWMEAWWPGSTWNPSEVNIIVEGDYEDYFGRSSYPDIGGCYYACRLAVAEFLNNRRKQASVIVFREIYPGFNIPIGVWFVRENIRRMFRDKPLLSTNDIREVLNTLDEVSELGSRNWINKSRLLRRILYQTSLFNFVKGE